MGYFRSNTSIVLRVGMPVQVYMPGRYNGAIAALITHVNGDNTVDCEPFGHHSRQMGTHPSQFSRLPVLCRHSDIQSQRNAWPDDAKFCYLVSQADIDKDSENGPAIVMTGGDKIMLDPAKAADNASKPEPKPVQPVEEYEDPFEDYESQDLVWDASDDETVFLTEVTDLEGETNEITVEKMGAGWFLATAAPGITPETFDSADEAKHRAGQFATAILGLHEKAEA